MVKVAIIWDDGLVSDLKLIEILHELNLTSSFALAPNTYKNHRILNDSRDAKYGLKVSLQELKHFEPFEIINHSANHRDFKHLDRESTKEEIVIGRTMLEDFFSRQIDGFCYPYGVKNNYCETILIESNHKYARNTKSWPRFEPNFKLDNLFDFRPTAKWNHPNIKELITKASQGFVVLWGHTYEFTTVKDWDLIKNTLLNLKNDPEVEVTNVSNIINSVC